MILVREELGAFDDRELGAAAELGQDGFQLVEREERIVGAPDGPTAGAG